MKTIIPLFIIGLLLSTFMSCNIENKKTRLMVVDNNRHYFPIQRGENKELNFVIQNIGDHPFILSDVFTSCECLTVSNKSSIKAIPAGQKGNLLLHFKSTSNIGYAKYYITLYGNLDSVAEEEITFDINIVPESGDIKDYEEIYTKDLDKGGIKQMVDGKASEKGYYIDLHTKKE